MVHTVTARHTDRASQGRRRAALPDQELRPELPAPTRYVLVPDPLIAAYAHDPLTVGVYVAIARLAMATKGAVPLAARDLVAWMGSDRDADRAAIMRRIVKLEERGWLLVERATATKHRLLPTWGRDTSGTARPWRFDAADSGRPSHLRGRRVPLALLDDYLGRLDPHPGHGQALISRYFTQPLLDLADIGVYAIGLRAEVTPTPRLCHLGLHSTAGMLLPTVRQSLLQLAATGQLTTLEGNVVVAVHLSVQGHARLGIVAPTVDPRIVYVAKQMCGSIHGSPDGSRNLPCERFICTDQDDQKPVHEAAGSLIAWDVGMLHEPTTQDSTPNHALSDGGGALDAGGSEAAHDPCVGVRATRRNQRWPASGDLARIAPSLAADVIASHRALNRDRPILPGEWCELLALQGTHGVDQLLIWQARASRAGTQRPYGITPAYYHACAAREACAAYRPGAAWHASAPAREGRAHRGAPTPAVLDPACDTLLRAMGVRERQKLAAVPYDLIASWQIALEHPGMAAQFTAPVGFAVAQMQRGNPPPIAELDRWAERAHRKEDRYETWRHVDAPTIAVDAIAYEQQLEARVRALAPPNADLADMCELARCIEAGATDAEALAHLRATQTGGLA